MVRSLRRDHKFMQWASDSGGSQKRTPGTSMAKKSSTLPLNMRGPKAGMPLYRWLYEELRAAILAGRLHPGARLPATRDLAAQYGISRPTIVTAFEQLQSEGYVDGKVGSGTYVSRTLPDELLQAPRAKSL